MSEEVGTGANSPKVPAYLFPQRLSKLVLRSAPDGAFCNEAEAREAVSSGRVAIDGCTATDPDTYVFLTSSARDPSPSGVKVALDGEELPHASAPPAPRVYYIDKPMHSVCDMSLKHDPVYRACASLGPSFFPIGQLDISTTGLLLITNSGDLAQLVNLPGLLPKTYRVGFNGPSGRGGLSEEQRQQLLTPRDITRPSEAADRSQDDAAPCLECFSSVTEVREAYVVYNPWLPAGCTPKSRYECDATISSGQNHVVKRVMKSVGIDVMTLRRVAVGPVRLPGADGAPVCKGPADEEVPVRRPEPPRKKLKVNDPISRSTPTPVPVEAPQQSVRKLMEQLDFDNTLAMLRRCDLICRWRQTRDPRLSEWLCMTDEEHARPCYNGFKRLKCKSEECSWLQNDGPSGKAATQGATLPEES